MVTLKPSQKSKVIQNFLTNAVELGLPVLMTNVGETLDPNITAILENKVKIVNKKKKLKFLDKWLS